MQQRTTRSACCLAGSWPTPDMCSEHGMCRLLGLAKTSKTPRTPRKKQQLGAKIKFSAAAQKQARGSQAAPKGSPVHLNNGCGRGPRRRSLVSMMSREGHKLGNDTEVGTEVGSACNRAKRPEAATNCEATVAAAGRSQQKATSNRRRLTANGTPQSTLAAGGTQINKNCTRR